MNYLKPKEVIKVLEVPTTTKSEFYNQDMSFEILDYFTVSQGNTKVIGKVIKKKYIIDFSNVLDYDD